MLCDAGTHAELRAEVSHIFLLLSASIVYVARADVFDVAEIDICLPRRFGEMTIFVRAFPCQQFTGYCMSRYPQCPGEEDIHLGGECGCLDEQAELTNHLSPARLNDCARCGLDGENLTYSFIGILPPSLAIEQQTPLSWIGAAVRG